MSRSSPMALALGVVVPRYYREQKVLSGLPWVLPNRLSVIREVTHDPDECGQDELATLAKTADAAKGLHGVFNT
jgi:hypothetical protein